jgi:AraC-like DNA-binding protein
MNALTLIGYGHTVCSTLWGMHDEVTDFCRIYYVLNGTCSYSDAKRNLSFADGHLYLLPQYSAYNLEQDISDPFFVLWQHVRVAGCCVREIVDINIVEGSAQWHILRALECLTEGTLIECAANEPAALQQQLTALLTALIATLESKGGTLFSPLDLRLGKVWAYVQAASIGEITVQEMANRANMERSYFSRLFRQQIGVSPQQWLLMTRLTYAAQLLKEGRTVAETANLLGYADSKAFSRAFLQQMHSTPSAYHKSHILQP